MSYNFIKNNKDVIFIDYNKLVESPEENINKIYTFLNIPKFKHNFTVKKQFTINNNVYDDSVVKSPMHTLRTGCLKKSTYNHIKIPNYIIKKYQGML